MKKRCTVVEFLDLLEEVEGKRITETALRKSLKRNGVSIGRDHKIDVAEALGARKNAALMDKTNLTAEIPEKKRKPGMFADSYPEARIKQIELQCQKIQIEIDKQLSLVVDRLETEAMYLKELQSIRKVIEDWRAHETAKHPSHVEIIGQLADGLIDKIRERSE